MRSTVFRSRAGARRALYGKGGGMTGGGGCTVVVVMRALEGGLPAAEKAEALPPVAGGATISSVRYSDTGYDGFEHSIQVIVHVAVAL